MDKILPQIVVFHDGLISVILFRPKYTSLLVYFFSFIFHPARALFGSAR